MKNLCAGTKFICKILYEIKKIYILRDLFAVICLESIFLIKTLKTLRIKNKFILKMSEKISLIN